MSTTPLRQATIHVNGERLLTTLAELATFGADRRGGVSREGFSPPDDAARDYVATSARAAGLQPEIDQAGNLIVRMPSTETGRPTLLLGSHIDSVTNGGRLDGAYGVVAALETMRTFVERDVRPRYEPVMVAFANEEGALFPYPFWGSRALVGSLERPEQVTDRHGRSIRGPLARAGGDLDDIAGAAWPPGSISAFLELHVEQGPVLEQSGQDIGIVDAIVGRVILDVTVTGEQNHAGSTPMDQRTDALVAAAEVVLAVEAVSRGRRLCLASTVGELTVDPGQTNVIPGRSHLTLELRDTNPQRLQQAELAVREAIAEVSGRTGVGVQVQATMRSAPVPTDPLLMAAIGSVAEEMGLRHMIMPSGAGHDAQIIAAAAPIGMIFVPSRGGLSHNPDEYTSDEDLVQGADVLATVAARL